MAEQKKVALVTGGGAGIGRATALACAQHGYNVALLDASESDAETTRGLLAELPIEVEVGVGDVSDAANSERLVLQALERWNRVDALVANAGARVYGTLLEATEADWERVIAVNLRGVAHAAKAVLPTMIKQRHGAIVVISSANALVGRADMPLYDATKAAVLSLTRSLAVAHGKDGVRVNAICPGYTVTDFHERAAAGRGVSPEELRRRSSGYGLLGRPAEPAEIAAAIYFLVSDEAAMITGQTLCVDAGMSVTSGSR
jgi:meso-butanediol dehydrogenase/(S,S)-butanediol dehydrogenase/diacetyl reductase